MARSTGWSKLGTLLPSLMAVATLALAAPVHAQESAEEPLRLWAFAGLGVGSLSVTGGAGNDGAVALLLGLAAGHSNHRVTLRGSGVAEILGDGVADLGLLYGRTWISTRSEASLSAGVALVRGEDCPGGLGSGCEEVTTVGLPFSATASFRPARVLGIGLEAFGDVNSLSSFVGLAAIVEFGTLR